MGKVNAYLMDVQEFVWDYYNSSGDIDTTTGVSTVADIIALAFAFHLFQLFFIPG